MAHYEHTMARRAMEYSLRKRRGKQLHSMVEALDHLEQVPYARVLVITTSRYLAKVAFEEYAQLARQRQGDNNTLYAFWRSMLEMRYGTGVLKVASTDPHSFHATGALIY